MAFAIDASASDARPSPVATFRQIGMKIHWIKARLLTETPMPITPFLNGQAFEPELIQQMSSAHVRTCDVLRLSLKDDPATRLAARTIIELDAVFAMRRAWRK